MSNKYYLPEKSNRKSGGLNGHKGSLLKMVEDPDEIQKHTPGYFKQCGGAFGIDTVFDALSYLSHQKLILAE